MTNSDRSAQEKFRRDAINVMVNHSEIVRMRLDSTEKTVARAAAAIEQQTQNMSVLSANVERLERAISIMVAEGAAQRETVNNLIKLATALVAQRAS